MRAHNRGARFLPGHFTMQAALTPSELPFEPRRRAGFQPLRIVCMLLVILECAVAVVLLHERNLFWRQLILMASVILGSGFSAAMAWRTSRRMTGIDRQVWT